MTPEQRAEIWEQAKRDHAAHPSAPLQDWQVVRLRELFADVVRQRPPHRRESAA